MKRYKLITIIGNIASGKSTLTELLTKKMPAIKISADEFYKTNPFFPLSLKDRKRWSFSSDLWFLLERVKMARKYSDLLKQSYVVVDSGIPMSWVFANSRLKQGYYTSDEWKFYQAYHNDMTLGLINSDIIIHLNVDESLLLESMKKRNREFEMLYYNTEYLRALNGSIRKYIGLAENKSNIITIKRPGTDLLNDNKALLRLIDKITTINYPKQV